MRDETGSKVKNPHPSAKNALGWGTLGFLFDCMPYSFTVVPVFAAS